MKWCYNAGVKLEEFQVTIWKILAAVVVFLLVIAGFNYADPNHEISNVIRAIVAFVGAYVAFKYTPKDIL